MGERIAERLSRIGAWLGNWNDDHLADKALAGVDQTGTYRHIDRLSGWLYTLPERHR